MNWLDIIFVALCLIAATLYLAKAFNPKRNKGGCGCGTVNCKVPKAKLK